MLAAVPFGRGARAVLKPDLSVRLGAGQLHEDRWLVEVDMATEGAATVENKLRRHLAYRASGIELRDHGVDPRVLWVAPDAPRAGVLRSLVGRLDTHDQALFAVTTQADAVAFLAREARA